MMEGTTPKPEQARPAIPEPEQTQQANAEQLDRLLDAVYGSALERTLNLLHKYGMLYGLPHISDSWSVDSSFFRHCQRSVNFVVVALHDDGGRFFVINSVSKLAPDEPVGWKLPGGPVIDARGELLEEAAHRIVTRETSLQLDELTPIALLTNKFAWNGASIEHHGIAFLARATGSPRMRPDVKIMLRGTGLETVQDALIPGSKIEARFVDEPPARMAFSNRKVLDIARKQLGTKYIGQQLPPLHEEARASRRWWMQALRALHRLLLSKPMELLASRRLRRRIASHIGSPNSVLDCSAGDDLLICDIASQKSPELCVANDVSWKAMGRLRKRAHRRHYRILFTNHNISELPFVCRFDVVIFKNTLHHARTRQEALCFLEVLRRLAYRLIIVDVEDPRRRVSAAFFNWYYRKIQRDQGHFFYSQDQFQKLIGLVYGPFKFETVRTLRGAYMMAIVDFT